MSAITQHQVTKESRCVLCKWYHKRLTGANPQLNIMPKYRRNSKVCMCVCVCVCVHACVRVCVHVCIWNIVWAQICSASIHVDTYANTILQLRIATLSNCYQWNNRDLHSLRWQRQRRPSTSHHGISPGCPSAPTHGWHGCGTCRHHCADTKTWFVQTIHFLCVLYTVTVMGAVHADITVQTQKHGLYRPYIVSVCCTQ